MTASVNAPALALLAALGPAEGMAGAACVGLAPLHDLDVDGESSADREARHDRARAVCAGCRVLEVCRGSLSTLPAATVGVWAGVLLTGKGHR